MPMSGPDVETLAAGRFGPSAELAPGETLGGYRLLERVGAGGMGVVFRAEDLELSRSVAIKVIAAELADDAEFRRRFQREARLAARLDHPNVLPVYRAGEDDGRLF